MNDTAQNVEKSKPVGRTTALRRNQERDFLGRILRACDKPRFRSASKSVLGEAM